MCSFTTLMHPHRRWHLQALLGNLKYRTQPPGQVYLTLLVWKGWATRFYGADAMVPFTAETLDEPRCIRSSTSKGLSTLVVTYHMLHMADHTAARDGQDTSEVFFKIKFIHFSILWSYIYIFFDNKSEYFRGDLSNISAKTATLQDTWQSPE